MKFGPPLRWRAAAPSLALSAGIAALLVCTAGPAAALSEIQREELPTVPPAMDRSSPIDQEPLPSAEPPHEGQPGPSEQDGQPQFEPAAPELEGGSSVTNPRSDPEQPLPEIVYDLSRLPEPVRRMHALIVEACKSGDIERLRPLIGSGAAMTQLSLVDIEGDAVDFLKSLSGDSEGQEILAILEEVMEAGYVHLDAGTPQELYVWPYFFAFPLDKLDASQRVELFKLVTAGDYEDMKQFGAYIFYRAGIAPDGRWVFFVAGD